MSILPQRFTFARDQLEQLNSEASKRVSERLRWMMKRLVAAESRWQPFTDLQFDLVKKISEIDRWLHSPEAQIRDDMSDYDRKARERERADLTEDRMTVKEQLDAVTAERNDLADQTNILKKRYGACDRILKNARI